MQAEGNEDLNISQTTSRLDTALGITFGWLMLVQTVLIFLKVISVITTSWFIVILPVWISVAVYLIKLLLNGIRLLKKEERDWTRIISNFGLFGCVASILISLILLMNRLEGIIKIMYSVIYIPIGLYSGLVLFIVCFASKTRKSGFYICFYATLFGTFWIFLSLRLDRLISEQIMSYYLVFSPLFIVIISIVLHKVGGLRNLRWPTGDEDLQQQVRKKRSILLARLDTSCLAVTGFGVIIFLVITASYLKKTQLTLGDTLIIFIPLFITELMACIWLTFRYKIVKSMYPDVSPISHESEQRDDSEQQPLSLEDGNEQQNNQIHNQEHLAIHLDSPEAVNNLITTLHAFLNEQRNQSGEEFPNVRVLEWLRLFQQQAESGSSQGISESFLNTLPTFEYKEGSKIKE